MPCGTCGGNTAQTNAVVQRVYDMVDVNPCADPDSCEEVEWLIQPEGFSKYISRFGNSYRVSRREQHVWIAKVDRQEFEELGYIAPAPAPAPAPLLQEPPTVISKTTEKTKKSR